MTILELADIFNKFNIIEEEPNVLCYNDIWIGNVNHLPNLGVGIIFLGNRKKLTFSSEVYSINECTKKIQNIIKKIKKQEINKKIKEINKDFK